MKLLHVIHSFPPHSHGGIESYVQQLAAAQAAAGDDVVVAAAQEPGAARTAEDDASPRVVRLPPRSLAIDAVLHDTAAVDALVALATAESCDLVHIHHWHNTGCDLVARLADHGVPSIVTLHDYFAICPLFFRLRDEQICAPDTVLETCTACVREHNDAPPEVLHDLLTQRRTMFATEFATARAILVLSQDQAGYFRAIPGFDTVPFVTVPLPQLTEIEPETGPPATPQRRLVSWGGLVPGKGMHTLVAACERLTEPVELHHYGRQLDPEYAASLRRTAARTRLELHGPFAAETMQRDFPGYDLAIFPSLYRETHGIVVDEAMQLGLPVVVSDRGAPRERIGDRGATFRAGDAADLATVLDTALAPERLRAMRAAQPPPAPTMREHTLALHAIYEQSVP